MSSKHPKHRTDLEQEFRNVLHRYPVEVAYGSGHAYHFDKTYSYFFDTGHWGVYWMHDGKPVRSETIATPSLDELITKIS